MRVLLTIPLLQALDRQTERLPGLLDFALEGRHDVLVETSARGSWEAWLDRHDHFFADMWRRAEMDSQQRQSLTPSTVEVRLTLGASMWESSPMELTVDDAIVLLRRPLEILVEDETSDGLFLSCTVPGPLRPKWEEMVRKGFIRVLTLGGVTHVPRRLETRHKQEPCALYRSYVLIDSDAPLRWQSHAELGPDVLKAHAAALRHRVRIHVLARRMAENYIPPQGLQVWAQNLGIALKIDHAKAFARLESRRQHYHHLKKGIKPNEVAHYSTVSATDQVALRHALGDKTYEAFEHAKEADLRAYGVYDELTPLFQELIRLA
jgi:hypothetical protein